MAEIRIKQIAQASVPTPVSGKTSFFIDSADGIPKYKDSTGTVTSAQGTAGAAGAAGAAGPDYLSGFIEAPTAKTYVLDAGATSSKTINTIKLKTLSGTCTVDIKINGTTVTGLSSLSVTSTVSTGTATALNSVVANDVVTLVLTSPSSPVDLSFTLKMT